MLGKGTIDAARAAYRACRAAGGDLLDGKRQIWLALFGWQPLERVRIANEIVAEENAPQGARGKA